jgi:hypothetical protein
VSVLKRRLERYGFSEHLALYSNSDEPLTPAISKNALDLDAAAEADLLLNFRYELRPELVGRFRRSALIDIDPGLLQMWMGKGWINVAQHDVYFTIGERVGPVESSSVGKGPAWQHTPPCVFLEWWPVCKAGGHEPFTTVSHWDDDREQAEDDEGNWYQNDKRSGFLPFLDLPSRTQQPLELALSFGTTDADVAERAALQKLGWRVRDAASVTATPWDYQRYIQHSRAEFSCAKPSYVSFENAWISDRTVCYLASGKPAVVQHTGPSRLLPDAYGLFRFRNLEEARHCLEKVGSDYERQCKFARALAEEYFDAKKVAGRVLERALT